MTAPPVGARAYFLLGLLTAETRTIPELEEILRDAADSPDLFDWTADALLFEHGSPAVSLRALADTGRDGLRLILVRLEEFGLARRVVLDGEELWAASLTCP